MKFPVTNFFIFLVFSSFALAEPEVQNYLGRGSSLPVEDDSAIISSPDKSFTCGFYEVGSNAYGFAIWFTSSKDKTVVWMANRDRPVNGKGSKMILRRDGVMVLTDVDGSIIWQSNTTSTDAKRAELLDSGNLVLRDQLGNILWQSFDFPTDTLLPSQTFTKSNKLVSAIRNGSFVSGYYNMYFNNNNVLMLINDGPDISSLYWPDPSFDVYANGRTNYNSTRMAGFDDFGSFVSSDMLHFNASDRGLGVKRRLTIDFDGNLRLYSLNNLTGTWGVSWEAMSQMCNIHGLCGRNGICVYIPQPQCICPPGYEISDPSDWNQGCKPMFNLSCSTPGQVVKFLQLSHTDYYGFDLNFTRPISFEGCMDICLKDCRCEGFSYRLTGEGVCFAKSSLFNGFRTPNFPGSIFLKLPANIEVPKQTLLPGGTSHLRCESSEAYVLPVCMYNMAAKRVIWPYLFSFASAIGVIEVVILVAGWLFFRRHGLPNTLEDGYRMISRQFRRFGYAELNKATNKFKEELGRGGSGSVYKGVLPDERVVAVKRLADAIQGEEEFWAEVSTIGKINHMNLVRMWGFCSEGKHRLLVYEYLENGSLDRHLFTSSNNFLGWRGRFKVALGTAKALAYLHHECLEWVIHCDVKPENILLDSNFEAKVADFGLAKLVQRGGHGSHVSRIRGTKGYMAPEWALNFPITGKVDIYSYGVVVLEMVRGIRLPNWETIDSDQHEPELLTRFVDIAKSKMQRGEDNWVEHLIDTRLKGEFSRNQAERLVEIGFTCIEEDRMKRPTMASVVQLLVECEEDSNVQDPL